jgi:hypothetical protein
MVTASQRYATSRGISSLAGKKLAERESYRQAETEYYKTEEGQKYLAQQKRLEEVRQAIDKIKTERKIDISQYESQGYTKEQTDGTIVLKAPQQRYRSYSAGKNSEYSTYTPEVITIQDGMIVRIQRFRPVTSGGSGKSKHIKPEYSVVYGGEGDKTETYYKGGDLFRTAEFKAGQYVGGRKEETKHYGNKYWEAAQAVKAGKVKIEDLPDDIKKSGYIKELTKQVTAPQGATKIYKGEIVGGKGFEPKTPYVMANILGKDVKLGRSLYEKLEKEGINMPKEVQVLGTSSMETPTYAAGSEEVKAGKIFKPLLTAGAVYTTGAYKAYSDKGITVYPKEIQPTKQLSVLGKANLFVSEKITSKIIPDENWWETKQSKLYEQELKEYQATGKVPRTKIAPNMYIRKSDKRIEAIKQNLTWQQYQDSDFGYGMAMGAVRDIRDKPVSYGLIAAVSFSVGFLRPIAKATKIGSMAYSTSTGILLGATWLGTKGYQFYQAPTMREKGEVFASATLESGTAMLGYSIGVRSGTIAKTKIDLMRKPSIVKTKGDLVGVAKTQTSQRYPVQTTKSAVQQKFDVKIGDRSYDVTAYQQQASFENVQNKFTASFGKTKYTIDGKPSTMITYSASGSKPVKGVNYGISMSKSGSRLSLTPFRGRAVKYYTVYDSGAVIQVKQPTYLTGYLSKTQGGAGTKVGVQQITYKKQGDITFLKGQTQEITTGKLNQLLYGKTKPVKVKFTDVVNVKVMGKKGQTSLMQQISKSTQQVKPQTVSKIQPEYTFTIQKSNILSAVRNMLVAQALTQPQGSLLGLPIVSAQPSEQKQIYRQVQDTRQAIRIISAQDNIAISRQDQSNILSTQQVSQQSVQQAQRSLQAQQQASISKQEQIQKQQQLTTTQNMFNIQTPIIEPVIETPPIITGFDLGDKDKTGFEDIKEGQDGYHAYAKRTMLKKGKGSYQSRGYEKITDKPLSKEAAKGKLFKLLDQYANRSGYIKKANKKGLNDRQLAAMGRMLAYKFRANKKNPHIFTEKTAHAIDSYEEKQGIPYEAMKQRKEQQIMFLKGKIRQAKTKAKIQAFSIGISQKKAGKEKQISLLLKAKKQKKRKGVKFL